MDVRMPDGTIVKNVPEGITQAELLSRYQAYTGKQEQPQARERSAGETVARTAGLGARGVVQGIAALAGIPANALGAAWNLTAGNLGAPRMGTDLKGAVSEKLDAFLPKPETPAEHIGMAGTEAVTGGGPFLKAAQMAPAALQSVPLIRSLVAAPKADMVANATGGLSSEAVRQAGGPEWLAQVVGAAAPLPINMAAGAAGVANRGVKEVVKPFTEKGQKQVAADVVGRLVQDKTAALENLTPYNYLKALEEKAGVPTVGVPGSKPTAGAVSGDYGLIGAQQLLERGEAGPTFAVQRAENNAARIAELSKLRATQSQLDAYIARREEVTKPLRDAAFSKTKGPVNVDSVLDEVFRTFRSSKAQGADAQRALNVIYDRLEKAKAEGAVSPADLYNGLHKDLNQMVGKGLDTENGRVRLAAGVANGIKNKLADAIEEVAPGFRKYLRTYSRLSRPIERLEYIVERLGGDTLKRVTNDAPMVAPGNTPEFPLSQSKMRSAVGDLEGKSPVPLAPYQRDVLGRVIGDLNSAELAARGGKPPGSDTYQNIAAANFMDRVLGQTFAESGVAKSVQRPLNALYRPFEARINDLIVEAFQDPKKMEELLRLARTQRQSPQLTGLLGTGVSRSTEGLLGSLLAQ